MKEVTAQVFREAFEQVTLEQMQILLDRWPSQPRFTAYVKSEMIARVAEILECNVQLEYPYMTQRVDIVLTRPLPFPLAGKHSLPINIVAAVEHENNFGGSHQEILKLRRLDAPLGVMITYVGNKKLRTINEYNEVLSQNFEQNSKKGHGELLAVFGPYGMQRPHVLHWEYWTYQENGFQRLT